MDETTIKAVSMITQLNFGFNLISPELSLTFSAEYSPVREHMLHKLGFEFKEYYESGLMAEYQMGEVRVFLTGYRGPNYYT